VRSRADGGFRDILLPINMYLGLPKALDVNRTTRTEFVLSNLCDVFLNGSASQHRTRCLLRNLHCAQRWRHAYFLLQAYVTQVYETPVFGYDRRLDSASRMKVPEPNTYKHPFAR